MIRTLAFDETGRCVCACDDEVAFEYAAKVIVVNEPLSPNDVWYDFAEDKIERKEALQCEVSANTIAGLPVGTVVEIDGDEVEVDDGVFELSVAYPQTVIVGLRHVKHMHRIVEVPCEVQA